MTLPSAAVDHYRDQQAIAAAAVGDVQDLWSTMGENFDLSWTQVGGDIFSTVVEAQGVAAASGIQYVPAVLDEQGIDAIAPVQVNPARFEGGTRDGRPAETLLHGAVYRAKQEMLAGADTRTALSTAGAWLTDVTLDLVRDANRQAVAAGMTATPGAQGWVRMLNPPSCRFCITLAGKFFRWNQGFQAHPGCDCRHVPSTESVAGDFTVDPYAYFGSLPAKEQDRIFGKVDAQALRDGADIYRVTNTRNRGLASDALKRTPGRNRGWQSRRWDTPSKMTVDDVYAAATDRPHAIRLLEENGFITGPQTAGGNLIGNAGGGQFGDLAAGALGRGGTRKGATAAYRKAVASGVRDPLEPATQTAAERRLHTAVLRKQAVDRGSNPFAANSQRDPLTPAVRALVQRDYDRQLRRLKDAPEQVRVLARLLGVL
ncbi:hypothetical protein C5B94_03950 [Clavibacter michiganensis]|uniref:VG15 protein n=1 Tax=Clavibacter michiganensis TaxID=28447 RepID=UPI000CE8E7E4|nr:hypothetical protein [Clavibacter michiganensis]PPF56082.1 hypothetical protein C5B94_03950 [Clavibacter michiganensis]